MEVADDLLLQRGDERAVHVPLSRARLNVHGRLGGDPVPLLRDGGELPGEGDPVLLARAADLERHSGGPARTSARISSKLPRSSWTFSSHQVAPASA